MQGFSYDEAKEVFQVGDEFQVEAMAAVGRPGRVENLAESLQAREIPSNRKKVAEIIFEGGFPGER